MIFCPQMLCNSGSFCDLVKPRRFPVCHLQHRAVSSVRETHEPPLSLNAFNRTDQQLRAPEVLVGVLSARHHHALRAAIRDTWLGYLREHPQFRQRCVADKVKTLYNPACCLFYRYMNCIHLRVYGARVRFLGWTYYWCLTMSGTSGP